jgi:Spy/CpxP family protein refolding chaperone
MTFLSSSRRDKVSLIFFFASLCSFSALAQTAAPTPTPPAQTGQVGPGKCATISSRRSLDLNNAQNAAGRDERYFHK